MIKKESSTQNRKTIFHRAKWVVTNGIYSAQHCKLYVLKHFVLGKNFEIACVN